MINMKNKTEIVKVDSIFFNDSNTIRAISVELMHHCATMNIRMICEDGYTSKNDVEGVFEALNQQALDLLEDYVEDFKKRLHNYLLNAKAKTVLRRLDFDEQAKLCDVHIDFEVQ